MQQPRVQGRRGVRGRRAAQAADAVHQTLPPSRGPVHGGRHPQRPGVLDGSRSACELGRDPDAAVPGIFGPAHLPTLVRNDYVTNSNDSYRLANPQQPLEG
ncbi:hypothetical protein [Micromonospora sp. NPDC047740]|uniref:hypothetical protein n=1 Tax=Micromonospora sp. NPDC047740 TaxID=3364254 RepID=UPI003715E00B